jgi:hypothetical protein
LKAVAYAIDGIILGMVTWVTWLTTTRNAATGIAIFLFLAVVTANVRVLAAHAGWDDQLFLILWRRIEAHPHAFAMLKLGASLRNKWWFWLSLGLSSGFAIALWLQSESLSAMSKQALNEPPINNTQPPQLTRETIPSNRIGRVSWSNRSNNFRETPHELKGQTAKNLVLISSSPDNATVENDLTSLLNITFVQSTVRPLGLPDYSRDLDAPRFDAGDLAGITIHGDSALADFLDRVLQHCYVLHRKRDVPMGTPEYFHKKYPATISTSDTFVWLEIGKGPPLRPRACQDLPGN